MATPPSQTLSNNIAMPHPRAPIRSTTTDYEGWMRLQQQRRAEQQSVPEGAPAEQAVCPPPPKPSSPSVLLTHSRWQTDIVTFCSHIARDPLLRRAHVTEIQNRKSRKLPYLQEYILLFFAVGQRRFVARVDYAAWFRRGAKNPEPLLNQSSWCRQQVTVYHVQDGEEAATPWFEDDGSRGSEFVAALSRWSDLGASGVTVVSHHLSTARDAYSGEGPSLHDVCRLIEAVVLEAPPRHVCLKTASSYITSRSVLLVIRDSFPHDFACSTGEERELVPASSLEEPAWASLLQWYLPFTLVALAFYIAAVASLHLWVAGLITTKSGPLDTVDRCPPGSTPLECSPSTDSTVAWKNALKMMMHLLLDLPFPAALMYTWLASIDLQINGLVKRISARFLNEEADFSDASAVVKTWVGTFSRPWFNFVVGSCLGCVLGLALFLGILLGHGVLVMLTLVIVLALGVNYALPQLDDEEVESEPDNELPLLDCDSSGSESELFPSVAGPSSPR